MALFKSLHFNVTNFKKTLETEDAGIRSNTKISSWKNLTENVNKFISPPSTKQMRAAQSVQFLQQFLFYYKRHA